MATIAIAAVIFSWSNQPLTADPNHPPPPETSQHQTGQATGTNHPNLWLEYYDDNYIPYLIDTATYWTGVSKVEVGADNSNPGSIQICAVMPTCITTVTPDSNGNYFEGTKANNQNRGGETDTGDTDFWITKHPTTARTDGSIVYTYKDNSGTTLSVGSNLFNYKEIGFQTNAPTITAQTTANEYLVSFPNPIRYTPNAQGLVEANSTLKGINDKIVYQIQTSESQDFSSRSETDTVSSNLIITNNKYQYTINHSHSPDTQIWVRVFYQETRSGRHYNIYSQPTSFTTPTNAHRAIRNWPALWLEYSGDTYLPARLNVNDYYRGFQKVHIGMLFTEIGSLQFCGVAPTCVNGSPDEDGNYFDGDTTNHVNLRRGGTLATGDTDFWVVKHPTTTRDKGTMEYYLYDGNDMVISNGFIFHDYREIGFGTNTPTVEPQATADQYQVSWSNPTRYTPSALGVVERNAATKGIEDKTTYWIQTADNEDFSDLQESEVGPDTLTVNNGQYQHTVTHRYPPNTSVWVRIRYQETRYQTDYDIFSQPVEITAPDNATGTSRPMPSGGGGEGGGGGGGFIATPPSGNAPPSETPEPTGTGGGFTDTSGSVHETNIVQLADMGVTRGCNPPENSRFCPNRAVTRAEMATFLVRAFELTPTDEDPFIDTDSNVHRSNINRMAAAGISRGCNPPENSRFCPERAVTRAEMATFMTRVLQLEQEGTGFTDTAGNVHATNIRRFAEAGITRGCNPPENSRYCPERAVTRAEMATFLVRSVTLNEG